ncbi:MAG: PhoH family protein [Syntrophomonadaceae bacterium]|nr:PhoH family protein [Syntrophomonadaceae bacterium]
MAKTFVLDSSVILHSADSILSFEENIVVVPEAVIEEINSFRRDKGDLGENARKAGVMIDNLRLEGKLSEGVLLPNGGIFKVELNHLSQKLPPRWDPMEYNNRVLQVCLALKENNNPLYLVSKDVFTRIKADILGIQTQDFKHDLSPELKDQYQGRIEVFAASGDIDDFYAKGYLDAEKVKAYRDEQLMPPQLFTNQFVLMKAMDNPNQSALGIVAKDAIKPLRYLKHSPFGVNARNVGQKFYQEALLRPAEEFPLVICKGPAGTAKTFYSLAVGLEKVINTHEYRKILICRPNVTMDENLGFLPGTESDKLGPLMRGVNDNLEILVDSDEKMRYHSESALKDKVEELYARKIIGIEAVAYLRGRSITKQWIIIDEAQNLTPNQAKGIITRAGVESKIIMIGDPTQIDHPFLNSRSNGLCYSSEKMKGSPICCQVALSEVECERSVLAMEASRRM